MIPWSHSNGSDWGTILAPRPDSWKGIKSPVAAQCHLYSGLVTTAHAVQLLWHIQLASLTEVGRGPKRGRDP